MLLVSAKLAYNNITAVYKTCLKMLYIQSMLKIHTSIKIIASLLIRTVALQQYTLRAEL